MAPVGPRSLSLLARPSTDPRAARASTFQARSVSATRAARGGPNRRAAASPELRRLRRAPGRSGRPGLGRGVLQLLTLLPLPGLQGTPLRGAEFCKSSPKSPKRSFREAQSSAALRGASAGRAAVASVPQARLRASAVALSPESFAGMLEHRPGSPMRPQLVGTGCLGVSGGWDAVPVLAQPDRRDWSVR